MSSTDEETETGGTVQQVADQVLGSVGSEPSTGEYLVYRRFSRVLAYTIVTLGIYGAYWLYSVNKQLKLEYDPLWRTLALLIPVYDILVLWRISDTAAEHAVEDQSGPVVFLL